MIAPVAVHTNVAKPEDLEVVREGMHETTSPIGSAHKLGLLATSSAGKTGTAQFGSQGQTHAWYTGFVPYDKPQYVFSILIEGGGESYDASVPVAEEIIRSLYNEPLAPGQSLLSAPPGLPADPAFQGER